MESNFIRWFRAKYIPEDAFWYKIPDSFHGGYRPFDAICLFANGKFAAFEFKYQRVGLSFNLKNNVLVHQKTNLNKIIKNNQQSYLALRLTQKTYIFPWGDICGITVLTPVLIKEKSIKDIKEYFNG